MKTSTPTTRKLNARMIEEMLSKALPGMTWKSGTTGFGGTKWAMVVSYRGKTHTITQGTEEAVQEAIKALR